jgi:hypothetical protein
MQTIVPTCVAASREKMSLDDGRPGAFPCGSPVFGNIEEQLDHLAETFGLPVVEDPLEKGGDQVVGRGVDAHERHPQLTRRVHGPGMVDGKDPVGNLLHPLGQKALGGGHRYAEAVQDVGLHGHYFPELGQSPPLRVVGDDRIDGKTLLPEAVGEENLPYFHVNPDEDSSDLALRVTLNDPCVGVRVPETFLLVELPVLGREFVELLLLSGELGQDDIPAAGVGFNADFDRLLVDVTQLHPTPRLSEKKKGEDPPPFLDYPSAVTAGATDCSL